MWKPTKILLGPGGIKGFLELGFLYYMEQNDMLDKVNSYVGISIGAIIALLVVTGYSISEIMSIALKTEVFNDINSLRIQDIQINAGILSQKNIQETLENLIIAKYGKVLTLKELYIATGINLYITSLELDKSNSKPVHFSHLTHPDISCAQAVILSANLPVFFYRLFYAGKCYVDGALGDPYPIHLIDDGDSDVLGLYITSSFDNQEELLTYLRQILYSTMSQLRNLAIKGASSRCRHVPLEASTFDTIGISTNQEDKAKMITSGYQIASNFFSNKENLLLVSPDTITTIESIDTLTI